MKEIQIQSWTIYLWRNGDKIEGASPIVTTDKIKGIYRAGWEVEKVSGAKRNEDKHQEWTARTKVKNLLNNTLNVINWYGKSILDSNGNIDQNKLAEQELISATQAFKKNKDISDLYPIKKFKVENITFNQAQEYKFI